MIGDFAAGDGRLLVAANAVLSNVDTLAIDIDGKATRLLRRRHCDWTVLTGNFLSPRKILEKRLQALEKSVDLVVLNPPFSCRGGSKVLARIGNEAVTCSVAVAFVLHSLRYVSPNGQVLAILPSGALWGEKDIAARRLIRERYAMDVVGINGKRAFAKYAPSTIVVSIGPWGKRRPYLNGHCVDFRSPTRRVTQIVVHRGSIPVHVVAEQDAERGSAFVHTTDLSNGRIAWRGLKRANTERLIDGPAVLIPRVGCPDIGKICILKPGARISLSDCVFGLLCDSDKDAEELHNALTKNWELTASSYGGTGAPYTTVSKLSGLLTQLGFEASLGP